MNVAADSFGSGHDSGIVYACNGDRLYNQIFVIRSIGKRRGEGSKAFVYGGVYIYGKLVVCNLGSRQCPLVGTFFLNERNTCACKLGKNVFIIFRADVAVFSNIHGEAYRAGRFFNHFKFDCHQLSGTEVVGSICTMHNDFTII